MAIAMLSSGACGGVADDYENLYGQEARRVSASASKTDDVAFAKTLFELIDGMKDAPDAQAYILLKVVEFGYASPAGHEITLQAIEMLERSRPGKNPQLLDKKLAILKSMYARSPRSKKKQAATNYMETLVRVADSKLAAGKTSEAKSLYTRAIALAKYTGQRDKAAAIDAKRKRLEAESARNTKLKSLQAKLSKDPKDSETRLLLIMLYVVDRDAPDQAAKLLNDELDESLRMCVTLACKDVDKLQDVASMDMGQWYYKTLHPKAIGRGKIVTLERARAYYRRFLAVHNKSDMQSARVKMVLRSIDKALSEQPDPAGKTPSEPARVARPAAKLVGRVGMGAARGTAVNYADITVTQGDKMLFEGTAKNLAKLTKIQNPRSTVVIFLIGSTSWSDYTFNLGATRRSGKDGIFIRFADNGKGNYYVWNLACMGSRRFTLERFTNHRSRRILKGVPGVIRTGKKYSVKIELKGSTVNCYLDSKLIYSVETARAG